MSYAIMITDKIKTLGTMSSKYNHNQRIADMTHIIPELSHLNEDLIPLPMKSNKTLSYTEAWQSRINELPYYNNHKVRSNAVLGYEVMLAFSNNESNNIDLETWKKNSVKWLHDTFDVAPDGKSNVLHAVMHMDETGGPHIHAFVIPIDENGHLNAKRFTDGSRAMTDMQTSYANAVKETGLERGLMGSSAEQKAIRRMYAMNNDIQQIPDVKKGETAQEYRNRVLEDMQINFSSRRRAIDDHAVKVQRETDKSVLEQRDAIQDELEQTRLLAFQELENARQEYAEAVKRKEIVHREANEYEKLRDELIDQMYNIKIRFSTDEEEISEALAFHRSYSKGIEAIRETDPEKAESIEENMQFVLSAAESQNAFKHNTIPNEDNINQDHEFNEEELL